jgi:hypothetical protein
MRGSCGASAAGTSGSIQGGLQSRVAAIRNSNWVGATRGGTWVDSQWRGASSSGMDDILVLPPLALQAALAAVLAFGDELPDRIDPWLSPGGLRGCLPATRMASFSRAAGSARLRIHTTRFRTKKPSNRFTVHSFAARLCKSRIHPAIRFCAEAPCRGQKRTGRLVVRATCSSILTGGVVSDRSQPQGAARQQPPGVRSPTPRQDPRVDRSGQRPKRGHDLRPRRRPPRCRARAASHSRG